MMLQIHIFLKSVFVISKKNITIILDYYDIQMIDIREERNL